MGCSGPVSLAASDGSSSVVLAATHRGRRPAAARSTPTSRRPRFLNAPPTPLSSPLLQRYKRIMLKVSGEALAGARGFGMAPEVLELIAGEIAAAHNNGVQVRFRTAGWVVGRGYGSAWPVERLRSACAAGWAVRTRSFATSQPTPPSRLKTRRPKGLRRGRRRQLLQGRVHVGRHRARDGRLCGDACHRHERAVPAGACLVL